MSVQGMSTGGASAAPFFGALQTKLQANAATGTSGSSSSGSSTTGNSLDPSNLGTTFLNLLVQELKNQDPTQPMDPTAMVGQMISLNQLDQLIGINQTLNPSAATTGTSGATAGAQGGSAAGSPATGAASGAATADAGTATAAASGLSASQQSILAALAAQNATASTPLNLGALQTLLGGK